MKIITINKLISKEVKIIFTLVLNVLMIIVYYTSVKYDYNYYQKLYFLVIYYYYFYNFNIYVLFYKFKKNLKSTSIIYIFF